MLLKRLLLAAALATSALLVACATPTASHGASTPRACQFYYNADCYGGPL